MPHEGQLGIHFESDEHQLLGTLFLAKDDTPKPTVILLHGVPGIEKNYDIALMLRERGWNTLLMHYRGCWGSEGLYEFKKLPNDVCAALDYLERGVHSQVDTNQLVLIGHSMGGWAALLTAPLDDRIKALAVYGAVWDPQQFSWTLAEIDASFTPWLPGLSPQYFQQQWLALDDEFTPAYQIQNIHQPTLIIHGVADEVIPIQQVYDLAEKTQHNMEFKIHPNANHSFAWHRRWLCETLWAWLENLD